MSELSLATAATLDALGDAGLTTADVDGIVRCDSDLVSYTDLAESLGLEHLSYTSTVGPGGIAPAGMVGPGRRGHPQRPGDDGRRVPLR